MDNLLFTANTVLPVFLIVFLGMGLKRWGLMNDNFVNLSSRIVFTISLPTLIFLELSSIDFTTALDVKQIVFVCSGTLFSFVLSWLVSKPFIKDARDRSVFIQGSFRGNYAIIGLALTANMFGSESLGKASILLACILPLYNVLAVIALTVPMRHERQMKISGALWEVVKNPLIMAVFFAIPFAYFKIAVHPLVERTGDYLAALTLPLALIGIGGSLGLEEIKRPSVIALSASAFKIILTPPLLTFGAYLLGYTGEDLGTMFILFACPTAIVSFVMAEAMGVNGKLAGNIIVISTLASIVTISAGLFILRSYGLI